MSKMSHVGDALCHLQLGLFADNLDIRLASSLDVGHNSMQHLLHQRLEFV